MGPSSIGATLIRTTPHESAVLDDHDRANLSNSLRQLWLQQEHEGPSFEKLKSTVQEFMLPGGNWSKGTRSCDVFLDRAQELVSDYRREGTWTRYLPSWRKARLLLTKWLNDDRHYYPEHTFWGFNARTLRLPEARDYLTAVVAHTYMYSVTMTGPETMGYALNLMCHINDIPVVADFRVKVIKQAAKRLRTKAVTKKAGLSFEELKQINEKWGGHEQSGKRMVALAAALGFVALLRYSDLAVINIGGIFFTGEGVLICVPVRKNSQIYPTWVCVADTFHEHSVVNRLKQFLRELKFVIPVHGCINTRKYLFRDVVSATGHSHAHKRVDIVDPSPLAGARSLNKLAYSHYLSRFQEALHDCCGMQKTTTRYFGTHSFRSGGDTHLFNMGMTMAQRMDIGRWATALVERGYLRLRCKQMFAMVRQAGL
jgi:hypothetical protein